MNRRWCCTVVVGTLVGVNPRDSLLAAVMAVLWGLNFLVIDAGMGDVPPLLFLAVRFVVVLVPAVLWLPRPDVALRTLVAVGALVSLGQFGFLYVAMAAGLPPGLAALVLQAQVVFTIVIAALVLGERPRVAQVVGVAVAVVGLVVVALGRGGSVPLSALLLCLAGALSWGAGNVVTRAAGVAGGLSLTVWSALVVPLPALALSLLLDGPAAVREGLAAFGWEAALATLYTAVLASLVGYGIFNTLLARNRAADVVPWVLLAPVVAMLASAVLGRLPAPGEALGGAVMIAGVLVALRAPRLSGARTRSTSPGPARPATPAPPRPAAR